MFDDSDIPFNDKALNSSDSVKMNQDLKCPDCGSILRYIEPYDRYWCDTCAKYMEPDFGKEIESENIEELSEAVVEESPIEEVPVEEEVEDTLHKLKCPVCNYELQYFEEYDRYWCDMCAEFMPVNFGKPVENSNDTEEDQKETETFSELKAEQKDVLVPDLASDETTVDEKTQVRVCPVCKTPLRYIDEYKKWWCDACLEYVSDEQESYPSVVKEEIAEEKTDISKKYCPKCGSPLRRIEEYGRYWCDKCLEYVSLESDDSTDKIIETREQKIEIIPEAIKESVSEEPLKEDFIEEEETEVIESLTVEASPFVEEPVEEEDESVTLGKDEQISYVQEDLTPDVEKPVAPSSENKEDIEEELVLRCPKCNEEVRYIPQYDRFWCDSCGEYMPVGFQGSSVAVSDETERTDVSQVKEDVSEISDEFVKTEEEVVDINAISGNDKAPISLEEEKVSSMLEGEPIIAAEEEITSEALEEAQKVEDFHRSETADLDLELENEVVENLEEAQQISVVGAGESESVTLICPKCKKKTRYIEQYDRYWCDTCGGYMPVGFGKKEVSASDTDLEKPMGLKELENVTSQAEEEKKLESDQQIPAEEESLKCTFCGQKVRYIEQYQRYWCDNCEKYMPLNFGLEKIEVIPPSKPIVEDNTPSTEEKNAILCPKCGGETTYVSKYNKYWCENCSEYVQPIYAKEPDIDKSTAKTCPDCGEKLVMCEPCKHWWCPVCDKCYPERIFS